MDFNEFMSLGDSPSSRNTCAMLTYVSINLSAKNYVNYIHNSNLIEDGDCVGMEKTWCYREFTPKHRTYYVSFRPNQFIVVEKY